MRTDALSALSVGARLFLLLLPARLAVRPADFLSAADDATSLYQISKLRQIEFQRSMSEAHSGAQEAISNEAHRMGELLTARFSLDAAANFNVAHFVDLWKAAYQFTAKNTWKVFPADDTTFCGTGDISQMWLRDSSVQNSPYIPLAARSDDGAIAVQQVLQSVMKRQIRFMLDDIYASAFFFDHGEEQESGPTKDGCPVSDTCKTCTCRDCFPPCGKYTYQRDFELDSLLFPIKFHYDYWKATKITDPFDAEFFLAASRILDLIEVEQDHEMKSKYFYKTPASGTPKSVGLIWSLSRPSDDLGAHGYNIPQNIMAVVALNQLAEIGRAMDGHAEVVERAERIAREVDSAVDKYGVSADKSSYAFEVDGHGKQLFGDDANMPNLLWLPVLGYKDKLNLYPQTRRFSLSTANPWFFRSHSGDVEGLGSAHHSFGLSTSRCSRNCIWHLGLITQGMTAESDGEKLACLHEIVGTDAGKGLLHEGFDPDDPSSFNRDFFGWADSLFAQWVASTWG